MQHTTFSIRFCFSPRLTFFFQISDVERSRLTTIFIKITTHLKLTLQDMFRSFNDYHPLKVELTEVTFEFII